MVDRELHGWEVVLADESGQRKTVQVSNYWDPERPDTADAIGVAAAAGEFIQTRRRHVPIAVQQLG